MTQVLIVGAGPTGLMLAYELRRAGISVRLVDRAPCRGKASRAAALNPRTMEVLDQRGMVGEFLANGRPLTVAHFAGIGVDWSTLPTRYPYLFGVLQSVTENILERFAREWGAAVEWSTEVEGLDHDDDGVNVELQTADGPTQERVDYLIGCDGARSTVRRLAGITFDGSDGSITYLLGDVDLAESPSDWLICDRRATGTVSVMPLGALSGQPWCRVTVTEYRPEHSYEPMTLATLRECAIRVAGTDFGMHKPLWVSSFTDHHRQAGEYRRGRVLLAGDAAHIHPPLGGQGMNLGMQDAVNLGWKLASVIQGHASQALLDTYHQERHPQAAHVMVNTRAQSALLESGDNVTAMRAQLASLLRDDGANERLAAAMSSMDVCYAPDAPHPLIGRRVPDAEIRSATGCRSVFPLLHSQRPVLLDFERTPERPAVLPETVDYVAAQQTGRRWRLPVVGWVDVPSALLIRPDGYVAWASPDSSRTGLPAALDHLHGRGSAA
jgi:3-(3-hydroxy-phenyl)propionate hydroxylase